MEITASSTTHSALRLSEEQAAGRYRAAHRAMTTASRRAAALRQLTAEHPRRADYRQAYGVAVEDFRAALVRTEDAHAAYVQAQRHADTAWTATAGRRPITARTAA